MDASADANAHVDTPLNPTEALSTVCNMPAPSPLAIVAPSEEGWLNQTHLVALRANNVTSI